MAKKLGSYVAGAWVEGTGKPAQLVNPTTEEVLAETSTDGVDMAAAHAFARDKAGPALRALTFKERAALLRKFSRLIHEKRDELIGLGVRNAGNTRSDAKFDVDGASLTLAAYADLGEELGDTNVLVDGDAINIGRSSKLTGQHAFFPLHGVAVHINAFNFPAWGLAEKAAVALLAGVPVISKPATSTALMAHRIMELAVEQQVLPPGALSFLCGATGNLVDHLRGQDILAFTGSGGTGAMLRGMKNVVEHSVRVNIEADSLNAAILGAAVESGTDTWDLFLKDVVRDVTQKAGQKCTAIRRVFVHSSRLELVREALAERIGEAKVGDPFREDVVVGPVATKKQQTDVLAMIEQFVKSGCRAIVGGGKPKNALGVDGDKGFFVAPTLLEATADTSVVHEHEIFGPCTTLIPYDSTEQLIAGVRRGGGGLVASAYSDDKSFLRELVFAIASSHGRLVLGSEKVAGSAIPPGTVMAQLVHGGPGRAGGGEELGGLRGMELYLQRVALQGYGPLVASLIEGGKRI